ncbi:hypothetical protein [Liquorilactobacillus hordei]|uniref:hypothetical protein n=1 Tax=Liquorilactobacillus hordei TaxID=468911 RepID=UPI0039EB3CBD
MKIDLKSSLKSMHLPTNKIRIQHSSKLKITTISVDPLKDSQTAWKLATYLNAAPFEYTISIVTIDNSEKIDFIDFTINDEATVPDPE